MSNPLADATAKLLDVLTPLQSEDRIRVVQAVLTLLGESASLRVGIAASAKGNSKQPADEEVADEESDDFLSELPKPASAWVKKYSISREQLEHVFHFDQGKVQAIALPGSSKKTGDQVVDSYLVQGITSLLASGEASFSDEDARQLCKHFGCYDTDHHSGYTKKLGNKVAGSKGTGWKLTAPGLQAAADLIKQSPQNA